jgi:hypothetical protein
LHFIYIISCIYNQYFKLKENNLLVEAACIYPNLKQIRIQNAPCGDKGSETAPHILDLTTRRRKSDAQTAKPPGKKPWYPLHRRMVGHHSQSG